MPVADHFRWPVNIKHVGGVGKGWQQTSIIEWKVQSFTHVDAPLNFIQGGKAINEIPLSRLIGRASVIDVSYVKANTQITEHDLLQNAKDVNKDDIVLIKTSWDQKVTWRDRRYWSDAPYLTEEAAQWLVAQQVKAVGYDFPEERVTRESFSRIPSAEEFVIHNILLSNDILNIEYLINLYQLRHTVVQVFALPVKFVHAEGAPARVIALEE